MKFNFRKIVSVLTSTVMLSSTIALGAAANYPDPFVKGGNADVAVVYGSNAALTDVAAVVDITSNLASKLAEQTATGGTTSSASASGGDSVNLATGARKIYLLDSLNAARTSVAATDMPNVLKDGKFIDLTGTEYAYTQTIKPGVDVNVTFGNSGGDLTDPAAVVQIGTDSTKPAYNYTLSLSKNLNVTDSTNVQGKSIKVLGVDYVIGASSTNATLYLYGAGTTTTVAGGETKTVSVASKDHTVELISTSSSTAARISVDGVSNSVTKGSKYQFPGGLVVYVKDVTHPAYAGDVRNVELVIGTNSLKVANGASVKSGANEDSVKGTTATVTAAGDGLISGFTISVGAAQSKTDHLARGESFIDPVFGGLKLQFAGGVPVTNDSTQGKVVINTDNNQFGYVEFTPARSTKGAYKLTYAYDNNTASTAVQAVFAGDVTPSTGKKIIHNVEGENAKENDFYIINQGDAGTIVSIDSISIDSSTAGKVRLVNVMDTSEYVDVALTNTSGVYSRSGVNMFGGTGYTVTANHSGNVINITWSSSGTKTVFPRIKLKDGGWIAFLSAAGISNGTSIILPDGQTTLATSGTLTQQNDTSAGTTVSNQGIMWNVTAANTSIGGKNYNLTYNGNTDAFSINAINSSIIVGITACDFAAANGTAGNGPAILFIEPKKWNDGSYGNFICIPLTNTGGSSPELKINDPLFNGSAAGGTAPYVTWSSDSYKKQAADQYGTLVTKEDRTNENGVATLQYSSSQRYYDVLFTSDTATVAAGTSTTSSGVKTLGSVSVTDGEVASVSTKSLIVVGGSCVNTVAAKLLGSTSPVCGSAFEQSTSVGAGSFLIQSFTSPYAATKVATLVAGYNAGDTTNAAKYFITQPVNTAVGNKYKGTSATSATLTTTNSTA